MLATDINREERANNALEKVQKVLEYQLKRLCPLMLCSKTKDLRTASCDDTTSVSPCSCFEEQFPS